MSFFLLILGIALLYVGGEALVNGATSLGVRLGLSRMVVGLTVVAFGTSAPELAATLLAALRGVPELGVGNVIGSNTANVGLILGVAALICAIQSTRKFLRRELPIMLVVIALLIPLFWDGTVSRLEGVFLLISLGIYLWYVVKTGGVEDNLDDGPPQRLGRAVITVTLGIFLLVGGAQALVTGATAIARGLGVSEAVIGLTLVAFGTSLPELASSVVAASKRETDIVLGNVIGSNVFNVLAVLGLTSLVKPLEQSLAQVQGDMFIMLGFGVALGLLMMRRQRLGRAGGAALLLAYVMYVLGLFILT